MKRIIVGVDGSASAGGALAWACREGRSHGASVTAVLAWSYFHQAHPAEGEHFDARYTEGDARAALDAYIERAVDRDDAAGIERSVVCDLPARALLDAGIGASLLVVGSRGLGGFQGLLLGSVSQHCVHHATSPVAVIRDGVKSREWPAVWQRVVVGIDGSDISRAALRWAVEEGRVHRARVEVVHAWPLPYAPGHPFASAALDPVAIEEAARTLLDRTVEDEDLSGLPAPPERILVSGGAAAALIDTAAGADLLVVGSRGLGGFTGLLLGSVSHHVLHHAACPVIVVPG
jgi:nucleotide-binding universal stress UspA family protein